MLELKLSWDLNTLWDFPARLCEEDNRRARKPVTDHLSCLKSVVMCGFERENQWNWNQRLRFWNKLQFPVLYFGCLDLQVSDWRDLLWHVLREGAQSNRDQRMNPTDLKSASIIHWLRSPNNLLNAGQFLFAGIIWRRWPLMKTRGELWLGAAYFLLYFFFWFFCKLIPIFNSPYNINET